MQWLFIKEIKEGDFEILKKDILELRKIADTRERAVQYTAKVKEPFYDDIRYHVDKLELLVDDKEWTLPKYREILFLR